MYVPGECPYHCDRDGGRVREDEGHLLELAAAAPVLGESHPGRSRVSIVMDRVCIDGDRFTIPCH